MKPKSRVKKKIPALKTDNAAEDFIMREDLTAFELSGARAVRFEFEKKAARVNMRLPQQLLDAVKKQAARRGIPYQRFIRAALERAVGVLR